MSNSGNVSLNVQVVGQDEVSAMLAQIAKQAKKTEDQLKGVGNANITPETSGISKATAAFGNTVEVVDKAEEKFNKFVGAIGFVSAAFATVGSVYTFIKGIVDAKSAVTQTIASFEALINVNKELRITLDQIALRRAPNEAAKEAVELQQTQRDLIQQQVDLSLKRLAGEANVAKLQEERKKLAKDIAELDKTSADNAFNFETTQLKIVASKKNLSLIDALIRKTNAELLESKGGEAKLVAEIAQLERDRNAALRESAKIIEDNKRKYQELLYMTTFGVMGIKPTTPAKEKGPEEPKLPTGGARAKTRSEIGEERTRQRIEDDAAMAKAMEALDKRLEAEERTRLALQNQLSISEDVMEFEAAIIAEVEAFAELADTVDKASSSFDGFARSVIAAADAFPELGDAMNGINSAMQKHSGQVERDKDRIAKGELTAAQATVNAEQSRTQAIIEGSTAGLSAIAKLIGGKKAEYAIRAAGEVAMGFATLTNPVESAGHFVAAGLFAAAAGTSAPSGGGAGGGAGAAQETPSSSSMGYDQGGGGQRTVVYNFSTLIADRQQVGRAIRDSELVGQRNGYGRRRGV